MAEILQQALEQIQHDIARKTHARNQLDVEIARLQATAIGIQNALGQQAQAEVAWTQLVRSVLNSAEGRSMSAAEVRDTLQSWGYSFAGIQSPLAYINTVLQRLAERGEIVRSKTGRPFRFARFGLQ
jgi:hypothetical protein